MSSRGGRVRALRSTRRFRTGVRSACLLAGLGLLVPGCEEEAVAPPPGSQPEFIEPLPPVLGSVGEPLSVGARVLAGNGSPLEGVGVRFVPSTGGGSANPPIAVTDEAGVAVTTWSLGGLLGRQEMGARVSGFDAIATVVRATAFAPPGAFVEVSAGGAGFTCGVEAQGRVFCWGDDRGVQLGLGGEHGSRSTPAPAVADVSLSTVSVGWSHACALDTEGRAHCWGENPDGRLGTGGLDASDRPIPVAGERRFAGISTGHAHTCGVTLDGEVHCWGEGEGGRLGTGGEESRLQPHRVETDVMFESVSAGLDFTCGISVDGGAHCWGNGGPWLGNGDPLARPAPEAVLGDLVFRSLVAGDRHVCGVTIEGEAYCWGVSTGGRLGIGPAIGMEYAPHPVEGELSFRSVAAGGESSCGVLEEGDAFCWGRGSFGRLGDGLAGPEHEAWEPVGVQGGTAFTMLSVARGSDETRPAHVCGVAADGDVLCWGAGDVGQLGNRAFGVGYFEATPVPIWRAESGP